MTKDEILRKHEDLNEYHLHDVDREFIIQAMQEYADQQLRLYNVVGRSEQLVCDTCKSGLINYPEINRRTCRCGALGYNVTD